MGVNSMRDSSIQVVFVTAVIAMLASPKSAGAVEVEAIVGQPFGVAQITVSYPEDGSTAPLGRTAMTFEGPQGRVLYPTVSGSVLKRLLGSDTRLSSRLTVLILFHGDTPFDVTIGTSTKQRVTVTPERRNAAAYRRLLRRWWRSYNAMFRDLSKESEHPPLVETYLTSMLARRLNLETPLVTRLRSETRKSKGRQTLELLAGAESMRMQIVKATSLGLLPDNATADHPLPRSVKWNTGTIPELKGDVAVEAMAMRVPEECFYIRFGQYANFMWFDTLTNDYGGEIGSMVSAQGYRAKLTERFQNQIVLKAGLLAKLLGPQAVADMAVIGTDTFLRQGAAMGVVFQSRGPLLGISIGQQRQEALARERNQGATLTTVQIGGKDVSLLATPDNRLRSFYLVDGDYHLVTNSRALVERFLAVADGQGTLGTNDEFRYARSVVSTERDDTIFIYFSSAFFRNLLSPHYQIELYRRLQAATDIELITLAQLAAKSEGMPHNTVEDLIAAHVLPSRFGTRADQSRAVVSENGIVDSLRGQRGFFTPVPDVATTGVSADELQRYLTHAEYYAEHWQQVDPVLVALKRFSLQGQRNERITIDAFISPMSDFKYKLLMSMLADPTPYSLVPPDDNMISIEASLRGGILFPNVAPHRLFLGVQDREPLRQPRPDQSLQLLQIVRTAPGFLGAWPKPGFLDMIPLTSGGAAKDGFTELPFGLLRWQGRGFSVLSMDKNIITQASEQIGFLESKPAQVRVRIGDLSKARFRGWLNQMGYERARQVSVANARFMSILSQQLKVPLAESRVVAESLLNAQFVCPLGGKYEIVADGSGQHWHSTAWPASADYTLPPEYVAPALDWFRGLETQLVKYPQRLVIHAHVDMQRKEHESAITLPFFDVLKQGGKKDE